MEPPKVSPIDDSLHPLKCCEDEHCKTYTCALTIAVVSKVAREGKDPGMAYDILTSNSEIIDVDHQLSLEAGLLHAEIRRRIRDLPTPMFWRRPEGWMRGYSREIPTSRASKRL